MAINEISIVSTTYWEDLYSTISENIELMMNNDEDFFNDLEKLDYFNRNIRYRDRKDIFIDQMFQIIYIITTLV